MKQIHDINDLRKRLMQDVIDAAIDQRVAARHKIMCTCWWWILWTHTL